LIGQVVFAALVLVDFQRLRRLGNIDSAPLLAASILLDALNVFSYVSTSSVAEIEAIG